MKLYYNGIYFGSNDSKDVFYDNVTVYDKLKELTDAIANGDFSGGSGSGTVVINSSYLTLADNLVLERNGCGRVLQFTGEIALDSILLPENDRPSREFNVNMTGTKSDGSDFVDVLIVKPDGTIVSKYRSDQTETVSYFGSAIWVIASTESDTASTSENTIRYNSENGNIEILKDGEWVVWTQASSGASNAEVVNKLPETVDDNKFYIVIPDSENTIDESEESTENGTE